MPTRASRTSAPATSSSAPRAPSRRPSPRRAATTSRTSSAPTPPTTPPSAATPSRSPPSTSCARCRTPRSRSSSTAELFRDPNTLFMTLLYIMTFGSFIGYAGAFPTLISTVFLKDPQDYAWLGATCGSLSRVAGGFLSDYMGGAALTQVATTVQILATLIAGVLVRVAQGSDDNSSIFPWFVFFIVTLFTATGVGNASTFKQMATLEKDSPERRGILLGFTAAIAAYGAFVIPTIFQAGIKGGFLDVCFYVFAVYYMFCGGINYVFYLREDAPFSC